MMTRLRPFLWFLWIALITAPLIFVGLQYDWDAGLWRAVLRRDRLRFLANDFPQWFARHGTDLAIVAGVLMVLVLISRLGKLPAWTRIRSELGERSRGPTRTVAAILLTIIALILACRHTTDTHLEWAVMAGTYIVLAMGLNLTVGMTG